ncbi:FAD-dependent oxidoreductase [Actinospongicola halichondriae]|uniref:FAD-dependent oxidoreductase n=1 Tax=Actinospongicola halichondriae TaxID=3236844 RepID=UPI003D57D7E8
MSERIDHDGADLPTRVDCVVIGAGIAGLTTAVLLAEQGVDVAVVEARQIARGATGYSSAKVSVLHDLTAQSIEATRDRDAALAYLEANRHGFDWIERRRRDRDIECAWEVRPAVSYALHGSSLDAVEREVELLDAAGLDAQSSASGLPYATAGAARLADQAQFDPVPFVLDLAADVIERGGTVVEGVRVTGVSDGRTGVRVHTDRGTIAARWAVAATGLPFLDRGLFFARTEPQSSYVVACEVEAPPPEGMYLAHDGPKRSLRTAPSPTGDTEVLLVGGESHKTGQGGDTVERYRRLVSWADEHFGVRSVTHRFMTEDFATPDSVPFVGPLHPGPTSVLVVTGFNKWGFTNGVAAAAVNVATILGTEPPSWAATMSSTRLPLAGARELVRANLDVGAHLAGGWVNTFVPRPRPRRGQGRVVADGLDRVAVSVDETGQECRVSGVCPHLGAILTWNEAESTWDCPLHGSRFERGGALLHGPAVSDLTPQ